MKTHTLSLPGVPPKDPSKHKAWAAWLTLTLAQKQAKVQALMDKGTPTAKAAQRLGISRQTLNTMIQGLKAQGWRREGDLSPDEALHLVEQGQSPRDISDQLQVSLKRVETRLKTAGWHNPWRDPAIRLREQVKPLLLQDLSIREISDHLQVTYSQVLRAKNVLVAAEPKGTYPGRYSLTRKRAQVVRKSGKQQKPSV